MAKLSRGLRRIMRGEMPHLFVRWIDQSRENRWQRRLRGPGDTIRIGVGAGALLDLPKTSFLAKVLVKEDFERAERALVQRMLKPGDVFFDVGANVGLFTVLAGRVVGSSGRVVAVEPSAGTARLLRKQVELNRLPNVTIVECGLSDEDGELSLAEATDGCDAFNSFGTPCASGTFNHVRVQVRTLDGLVDELGPQFCPRLIKIDTEGWEPRVLSGAERLLSGPDAPDLMIEFCESALDNAGSSCADLFQRLKDLGYDLKLIEPGRGKLVAMTAPQAWKYANLYASKRL